MDQADFDVEAQRGLLDSDQPSGSRRIRRSQRYSGFFGFLLSKFETIPSDEELEMARQIRSLVGVKYDPDNSKHVSDLLHFWQILFPNGQDTNGDDSGSNSEAINAIDVRWKGLGFQSQNPASDFRGGGILSLYSMMYLAERYPSETRRMVREADSAADPRRSYLFACGCINVCVQLVCYLGLSPPDLVFQSQKSLPVAPIKTRVGVMHAFVCSPKEARDAFGELFSRAVMKLHAIWRGMTRRDEKITLLDFGKALDKNMTSMRTTLAGQVRQLDGSGEFEEDVDPDSLTVDWEVWWSEVTENISEGISDGLLWAKNMSSGEDHSKASSLL